MTTRPTLPQNNLLNTGVSIDPCTSLTGRTNALGTVDLDTAHYKTGAAALRLVNIPTGTDCVSTINISTNLGNDLISFWLYCPTEPSTTYSASAFSIFLSADSGFPSGNFIQAWISRSSLKLGWNFITVDHSQWELYGDNTLASAFVKLRFRVYAYDASTVASITISDLRFGVKKRPCVCITFDDGRDSQYTVAKPVLDAAGLPATFYVNSYNIGGSGGYMTLAQLQEMYADGHAIASHSWKHTSFSTLSDADKELYINNVIAYLEANSMPRAKYHLSYPDGVWDAATLSIASACGILTGRLASVAAGYYVSMPTYSNLLLNGVAVGRDTDPATVTAYIDVILRSGNSLFLYFHCILDTPVENTDYSTANFTTICNYIAARVGWGILDCKTIDAWYEGLTNPRYRSLPVTRT